MFLLSFTFVVVCGRFKWERICAGFLIVRLYMYGRGRSSYQERKVVLFLWYAVKIEIIS